MVWVFFGRLSVRPLGMSTTAVFGAVGQYDQGVPGIAEGGADVVIHRQSTNGVGAFDYNPHNMVDIVAQRQQSGQALDQVIDGYVPSIFVQTGGGPNGGGSNGHPNGYDPQPGHGCDGVNWWSSLVCQPHNPHNPGGPSEAVPEPGYGVVLGVLMIAIVLLKSYRRKRLA